MTFPDLKPLSQIPTLVPVAQVQFVSEGYVPSYPFGDPTPWTPNAQYGVGGAPPPYGIGGA